MNIVVEFFEKITDLFDVYRELKPETVELSDTQTRSVCDSCKKIQS